MRSINSQRLAKLYNERINFLLKYENFGRKCLFYYPPSKQHCPNCIVSASGLSSGKYRIGGPMPFMPPEPCPYCKGKGVFKNSVMEEDTLIVLFDHKMWMQPSMVASLPDNSAMIIGNKKRSWDKVVRAERVILNTDVYGTGTPYKLFGEPYPCGLFNGDDKSGSAFFYAYYIREGGG